MSLEKGFEEDVHITVSTQHAQTKQNSLNHFVHPEKKILFIILNKTKISLNHFVQND